jgi:hypothetical protein
MVAAEKRTIDKERRLVQTTSLNVSFLTSATKTVSLYA